MPNNPYGDKDGNGCFPGCGNSIVDMDGDCKYIEDVGVGDMACVMFDDGSIGFSKVWCLAHKDPEMETTFIQIDGVTKRVTLSPKHFIAVKEGGKMKDKMAKDVCVGDVLYVLHGKAVSCEPVVHIEEVDGKGVFAPFTESGRIVVNGILCSCYAEFPPAAAHAALSVHRQVYDKTPTRVFDVLMTPNENGVPIMFDAGYWVFKPLFAE